jgi:AraC-like DNA-binding protein
MTSDTTTFRMGPSQAFPDVIRSLGVDPLPILHAAGLDARMFDHAENRIDMRVLGHLCQLAVRGTRREDIGLLLAQRFGIEQLGFLGLIMAEGPDVRTALRNLCRLLHHNNRAAMLSLIVADKDATLKYDLRHADFEGVSVILDSVVAMMMRGMQRLCGPEWVPHEVHLSRRRPRDVRHYASYFRAPLRFNSVQDAIVFPLADLDRPVPRGQIAKATDPGSPPRPVEDRVRFFLTTAMGLEDMSLPALARSFGVSSRTVNRMLAREDTSFQLILDDVRSTRARHLLSRGDAPLAEIAVALGFGDASVFTRSFRRWTGSSPSAWRRQHRSV